MYVFAFNLFESVLWLFMAGVVGYHALKTPERRRQLLLGTTAFFFFSVSEMIELQTGAPWKPLWLFVWKAACVLTLIGVGIGHYRWQKMQVGSESCDTNNGQHSAEHKAIDQS